MRLISYKINSTVNGTGSKSIFLVLFSLLLHSTLITQWSTDPATNNAICTESHQQGWPTMISDGAGGAIMAWTDYRNGMYNIYAQHINGRGITQWSKDGIPICLAQVYPPDEITSGSDGKGGIIIAWTDWREGYAQIYAQRVNSNGSPVWKTDGIPISQTLGDERHPVMTSDEAGGAIISWTDFRDTTAPDIYAQRIDSSGKAQWSSTGVAICTAAYSQIYQVAGGDGISGAIFAWMDTRAGHGYYDIYAQRVDAFGNVKWQKDGVPVCTSIDDQKIPFIFCNGKGGAVIAWWDHRYGYGDSHIFAQRVNGSGAMVWPVNGIQVSLWTGYDSQDECSVVDDTNGGTIITFRTLNGIWAQRIDSSGNHVWRPSDKMVCVVGNGESQLFPLSVTDSRGGAIVSWLDYRPVTNDTLEIYSQRINANGDSVWRLNGSPVTNNWSEKSDLTMIADGKSGAIMTWTENRDWVPMDFNIYTQNIGPDGILGERPFVPQLLWRLNGSLNQPTSLSLRWHNVKTADCYAIELSSDSLFSSIVLSDTACIDTARFFSSLPRNTTYYWHVRSLNIRGISDWSDVWNFTTTPDGVNQYTANNNWNLISLPLQVQKPGLKIIFPTAISAAFSYDPGIGYTSQESLSCGRGYWLRFDEDQLVPIPGSPIAAETVHVSDGWNLIGTISDSIGISTVRTNPVDLIVSRFWGYENGYGGDDVLLPAKGYWIKCNGSGDVLLSSNTTAVNTQGVTHQSELFDRYNSIRFEDADNNHQTLYFTWDGEDDNIPGVYFELPPQPPAGSFDVRFSDQQSMEKITSNSPSQFPIRLSSVTYPLTIQWQVNNHAPVASLLLGESNVSLDGKGFVVVQTEPKRIILKNTIPSHQFNSFSLKQNYPNPFNSATNIGYSLPRREYVLLALYNLLGEKIRTLVDATDDGGEHQVEFDASTLPSGIYIYRLTTGEGTASRKLLLIK